MQHIFLDYAERIFEEAYGKRVGARTSDPELEALRTEELARNRRVTQQQRVARVEELCVGRLQPCVGVLGQSRCLKQLKRKVNQVAQLVRRFPDQECHLINLNQAKGKLKQAVWETRRLHNEKFWAKFIWDTKRKNASKFWWTVNALKKQQGPISDSNISEAD
ncbi:hypothetical protein NDU88_003312 [Pleurodeles waltl]|uniref:Uncharacterized protein n=1 Tax=Pleurodeles waltl TaxID=8319 RepID=A0AAV7M315_PLEWA|nr:hypothetical protein NDU88_003312 [Pleurodeles waltl]